jgi:phage protein
MREILFRGKCLFTGEWVYGSYLPDTDTLDENTAYILTYELNDPDYVYEKVDLDTVGQYTGLKDKNGKSFWEGDIFKEDDSGIVRSIFRVPGGLAFEDNPVAFGYDHRAPVYPYSSIAEMQNASWLSQCCEIIGNIHDNADLIKIDEI